MDEAIKARFEENEGEERNRGAITWRQFDRLVAKYVRAGENPERRGRETGGEHPHVDRQRSDHYATLSRRIRLLGGADFTRADLQGLRREIDAVWPSAVALATEVRVLKEVYPLMSDWAESQEIAWLANEVEDAVTVLSVLREQLVGLLDEDLDE